MGREERTPPASQALRLLREIGKTPFEFQGEAVERVSSAAVDGERLLVQAPTGAGKTLIAYLNVAVAATRLGSALRTIVVVPSRPLMRQHAVDAGWLRETCRLPVHMLTPDDPMRIWEAVLAGPGLICTTPHALGSRLERLGGLEALPPFDLVQFDEIDLFLTVDRDERRDIWPTLDEFIRAGTPLVGYTGTSLSPIQEREWTSRAFTPWQPAIPEEWLPFTSVRFEGVENQQVIRADQEISDELGAAYRRYQDLGGDPLSWRELKANAQASGDLGNEARRILTLHADRLLLFEGDHDRDGKVAAMLDAIRGQRALVLTRYVATAVAVAGAITHEGIAAYQADGRMNAGEAERYVSAFRTEDVPVLVITRDLGGRGLDFPSADTAVVMSPRSNYQTVAQELARIRSRRQEPKTVTVLYYTQTTETLKASRLADHLVRDNRFGDHRLFEVEGVPQPPEVESQFERAHFAVEEALPPGYAE
ncbi:MAG TPA: DEAD/DEAH box helicase, partial [Gaiellaceae bacterium]|nr:DEAD/DEAH box helicase [Gaiellaceae bacterium]